MNAPNIKFNDIRPFNDSELQSSLETLLVDKEFRSVISGFAPHINIDNLHSQCSNFKNSLDFQKAFIVPVIQMLIDNLCSSISSSGIEYLDKKGIIMSNHRDIVMDPTFLCYTLTKNNQDSCEIGIGDNLLKKEWIKTLVKANKCFIVKRDLQPREMARTFVELSSYINHTIKDCGNSVWIAQREGRAKDSNDRTQESILKMFALGGNGPFIENLKSLNIHPLSISYEYDPCDYLKAKEFQQRRDNPDFTKNKEDDLISMQVGITGYKGAVHYAFTPCINPKLEQIEQTSANKKEQAAAICKLCDEQIFKAYIIYPINMVAYDMLLGSDKFKNKYTQEQYNEVNLYIQKQLAKIDLQEKDNNFLLSKILEMYANPLINQLSVTE